MDSLLANYASSDEEQQQQELKQSKTTSFSNNTSLLFSSLPQPKSSFSSTLQSLPQPSMNPSSNSGKSFSLFSNLPKPKSQIQEQKPKKVVQFRPPVISLPKTTELDDGIQEEKERNRRRNSQNLIQTPSVKSFLSSIPAPRNSSTLGVQSSSGSGRRSIIETEAPESAPVSVSAVESNVAVGQNAGDYVNYENYPNYQYATDPNAGDYVNYPNYQYATDPNAGTGFSSYGNDDSGVNQSIGDDTASYGNRDVGVDQSAEASNAGEYVNYANYPGYGNHDSGVEPSVEAGCASYGSGGEGYASYSGYGDNVQYGNNWVDGLPEVSGVSDNAIEFPGKKRGRHEIPIEVIEVKQEELIKNRPREDQAKLTGLAFGPSYQGKPSKLHMRKHQISSLYFDMKQNEMQLAERRAKGMLTKAETQAKYGW
ncbi:hypothetical protein TanjilG_09419 [Lupinus angustifolius]|uniref:Proline-rich protein PRCC n=1 Tax=Lupinus angustifolius TaxID=3871 RepID=A0A4P1RWI8_LUPAN|nr:hypothetical protein TanjilG_09419 [Lupinus angustifolius]